MLNIKIISILFGLLFLSCSNNDDYEFNPSPPLFKSSLNFKGDEGTLDIITWNTENFPQTNMSSQYVLEIVDSLNVDIIALQEIVGADEFQDLVDILNPGGWVGFRAGDNFGSYEENYQELAYLINTQSIDILFNPYEILTSYANTLFAYRAPYVLEFIYKQQHIKLINIHYKSDWNGDFSAIRLQASEKLYEYINTNDPDTKVIVLGDYNDLLIDNDNVFELFLNDNTNYLFADYAIAQGDLYYWSYPAWPSHIDHILITNELFNNIIDTQTILLGHSEYTNTGVYENNVSDHRPIGIKLNP